MMRTLYDGNRINLDVAQVTNRFQYGRCPPSKGLFANQTL